MAFDPDKRVEAFIQYNYKPYSKRQCFGRTLWLMAFCIICCFIGRVSCTWICINSAVFTISLMLLIINERKYKGSIIQRFLGDGAFFLAMAIELNFMSYRTFTVESGERILLLFLMLFLLASCIMLFAMIIHSNIAKNRYSKKQESVQFSVCIICSAVGVIFGGIFVQDISQQAALSIVATILLFLSLLIGIGSLNLLKVLYQKKLGN